MSDIAGKAATCAPHRGGRRLRAILCLATTAWVAPALHVGLQRLHVDRRRNDAQCCRRGTLAPLIDELS